MTVDTLSIENIDEFVNDENKIVRLAAGVVMQCLNLSWVFVGD